MSFRILRILAPCVALVGMAHAQINASLQVSKSQYLAGEPVIAVVTITNHAGRDLNFVGDPRLPWLDFIVKNGNGNLVVSPNRASFGAMKIGAGQTMARQVDLSQFFYLAEPGNFSVSAVVRLPGGQGEGASTNRAAFTLNTGRRLIAPIKVGVPGKPGETREYRLINFGGNGKSQIYAQVVNGRTGVPISTFPLGDALLLRKPLVTVDRNQRMHVMFLGTPTMWVHCQIDTDGKLVSRDIHQRGAQGDPQPLTASDGTVTVSNSIPYDAAAVAAARAKIHNASERPAFIYE